MSAKPAGEETLEEFRPTYAAWFWLIILTFGFGAIWAWWRRRRIRYEITDKRVIKFRGRLSSKTDELRMQDISRIQTSRSLGEKIIGGGTIVLDTGVDHLTISAVPNYSSVVKTIRTAQTS